MRVAPVLSGAVVLSFAGRLQGVQLSGIVPEAMRGVSTIDDKMVEGRLEALDADASGIVLGEALMRQFQLRLGVTVGEWGAALREAFGEYRGPTGVAVIIQTDGEEDLEKVKGEVERVSKKLGRTLTYVVGKPGLDGHSNGSEQIAARARQAGMNVIYEGIRFTPDEIVQQAIDSKAHVVGLSILSGSHLDLVK